ncbi:hypothetical protein [Peribacillus simplex]|uniref:hypothetical protein n=1 Tax=Peribacillus simplex TaxID=1478 RepID=UPI0024C1FD8B|nr:hypothetical protein [Peribacillus simplex]WHY99650.1 hypothetical protein QNH37_11110 [Peribacillus simplex]
MGVMNLTNPYDGYGLFASYRKDWLNYRSYFNCLSSVNRYESKGGFATFALPSIIAAISYTLVQEKHGSFDRVVKEDNEEVESEKIVTI